MYGVLIDEELVCKSKPGNSTDKRTVAVTKNEEIVGHLLRSVSKNCYSITIDREIFTGKKFSPVA